MAPGAPARPLPEPAPNRGVRAEAVHAAPAALPALGRRPALDGLRGVAVGLVLLGHARVGVPGAWVGVDLFFALSGFLITTLLLEEQAAAGRIGLGRFYARRALRLLPALAAVVGATLLYAGLGPAALAREAAGDGLAALLYVENWRRALTPARGTLLGHAWSLSIEEQFYLSWPLLVLLLRRPRRLLLAAALLGLGSALWRAARYEGILSVPRLYHGTDTRADTLLGGCALAALWALPAGRAALRRARRAAGGAVAALLLLLAVRPDAALLYRGGLLLVALTAAALVLVGLAQPPRLLLWPPLTWVGRISYGLYLWHYPVFQVFWLHGWLTPAGRVAAALLSLGLAAASFYGLERPFLAFRARLRPPGRRPRAG